MKLVIPLSKIDNLFKIDLSKFYIIEKQKISEVCLYIGMLVFWLFASMVLVAIERVISYPCCLLSLRKLSFGKLGTEWNV